MENKYKNCFKKIKIDIFKSLIEKKIIQKDKII